MIIPQYWAESRAQHRDRQRQITVRRFGWSDAGQAEAQAHADDRARDALARLLGGEKLPRREPKVPYNGAAGVPIREEIVSRHGDTVITRNAYGARCLNTPNVLFADIDFAEGSAMSWRFPLILLAIAVTVAAGWLLRTNWTGLGIVAAAGLLGSLVINWLYARVFHRRGGAEGAARKRIDAFIAQHPDWNARLYRTPAGLRLLAMHRTFDPRDSAVADCFRALGADPAYARMCLSQNCFRARVSPKPWRIGIATHMRPRPGVWPVKADRVPDRQRWIETYERTAHGYAACRFIEAVGTGTTAIATRAVQALHDEQCRATSSLPLA
ncbi:MAG: ATP synthase subunit I [Alphaproteobacteria bacterium]|nr:ATP synthase subunit I [Alphaproteobacteria bacterium]